MVSDRLTKPRPRLPFVQRALLGASDIAVRRGLLRSALGRAAFDTAYGFYKRLREAPTADRLARLVTPGGWAVDVGANAGFYTLRLARQVRDGARVMAIEPEAVNVTRLKTALHRAGCLDRVVVVEAALTDHDGPVALAVDAGNPADHRITDDPRAEADSAAATVTGRRLDSLLAAHGEPPVALIKIDVQGAEARVLAGAVTTIARCRPALFIELDHRALARFGTGADEIIGKLASLGYRPHDLRHGQALTEREVRAALARHAYLDMLFLPEDAPPAGDGAGP